MEHSTIEQTGAEAGQVEDLVCFQGNESGFRAANSTDRLAYKKSPHTNGYRYSLNPRDILKILLTSLA